MTDIELVKGFEGYRDKAYQCSAGVWTIGYGTTVYPNGRKVREGDTCTLQQAEEYLDNDLKFFRDAVGTLVTVELTDNERAALVSFVYNIGARAFGGSTMLKLLNKGQKNAASLEFLKWTRAGGKVLRGLQHRRLREKEVFES
jgi:lysozyme